MREVTRERNLLEAFFHARDGRGVQVLRPPHAHAAMTFACRIGCGACCIAPSITTPFASMPNGKRAGERCVHLDAGNRCVLFGKPERPQFCIDLKPEPSMCGATDSEAMASLESLERRTRP